jgi:hypothetical protein
MQGARLRMALAMLRSDADRQVAQLGYYETSIRTPRLRDDRRDRFRGRWDRCNRLGRNLAARLCGAKPGQILVSKRVLASGSAGRGESAGQLALKDSTPIPGVQRSRSCAFSWRTRNPIPVVTRLRPDRELGAAPYAQTTDLRRRLTAMPELWLGSAAMIGSDLRRMLGRIDDLSATAGSLSDRSGGRCSDCGAVRKVRAEIRGGCDGGFEQIAGRPDRNVKG